MPVNAFKPALLTLPMLLGICATLTACGGGSSSPDTSLSTVASASSATAQDAGFNATPSYHLAPALPPSPDASDSDGSESSARRAPVSVAVATGLLAPELTAQATADSLPAQRAQIMSAAQPLASGTSLVSFFTPAQIRAAYGFAKLPAATTANKGAGQGSGQVIAIIDANHNPGIGADLNTFSAQFGLPSCTLVQTTAAMISSGKLVATPAAGSGCSFQTIYGTASGTATTTAPAIDKGWATEIALDVQWAHAMAPQATLVLIEMPNSSNITAGLTLARKIGASVVSMSWGGAESAGVASYESLFAPSGISYVASSGDAGHGVNWPAVSPSVLGVGGTQLTGTSEPRNEVAWSGSGGGVSSYIAAPSWQTVARSLSSTRRVVPDVAYNASTSSAVYVYMTPSASTGTSGTNGWLGVAGTSAGAPQWAGLAAVLNASRALNGKAAVSGLPGFIYTNIASRPGIYATTLQDITKGSNGSCSTCTAGTGYDAVTGLGTPNADVLVSNLAVQ